MCMEGMKELLILSYLFLGLFVLHSSKIKASSKTHLQIHPINRLHLVDDMFVAIFYTLVVLIA